jgi:hypothetical protein
MHLYFPPSGFGFWYYLGQYCQLNDKNCDGFVGASSGSLLCICTLIERDDLFEFIKSIALDTLTEYRQTTWHFNLYILTRIFINKLLPFVTKNDLSKIKIITTKVSFRYFIPTLQKRETVPTSLEHLCELALASTYIPFASNCGFKPYYTIDNEHFIDGGAIDWYVPSCYFVVKPTVTSLIIPTPDSIYKLYMDGFTSDLTIHTKPDDPTVFLITPLMLGIFAIAIAAYFNIICYQNAVCFSK